MLITEANSFISAIHDRMPVLLDQDGAAAWLSGEAGIELLKPAPEDYIIPKYRWSTFHQTYFDLALRSRGIDTIILSGGAVDVGIASTAYAARDLDYNLIIVRDACSNSHDDSMAAFMDTIFPRMARVRTTNQAIELIRSGAK